MVKISPIILFLIMLCIVEGLPQKIDAQEIPKTPEEFLGKLNEIVGKCRDGYESVEKRECLWSQDQNKCGKDPTNCKELKKLQAGFTSIDYEKTLEELHKHLDENAIKITLKIKKGKISDPEVRRKISEDMQSLASTCAQSIKSLNGILKPLESLYLKVFKKTCPPAA